MVDGEAEPGAFRPRPIPLRQRPDPFNDVAQTSDVQPVALRRLHARNLEHATLREDLQAVLDRIAPRGGGHLVGEHVGGECVEDVAYRAHPADAHTGPHAGELHALVLDRVRQVGEAHLEFPVRRHAGATVEHGGDRRKRGAFQPGLGVAALVDGGAVVLRARRMEVVVADVVLARPLHADRATESLGEFDGLEPEIRLRLAPEGAAEQRRRDRDVLRFVAEPSRDQAAGGLRILERSVDDAHAAGHVRDGHRRFHGRMGQERCLVGGGNLGRAIGLEDRVDVALLRIGYRRARLVQCHAQLGLQGIAGEGLVGAVGPLDLEVARDAHRGVGVLCDHGDAADGVEHRSRACRRVENLNRDQSGCRVRLVEDVLHAAAEPRATHHDRGRHVRHLEVRAVGSLAADDVGGVDVHGVLADVAMLRLALARRILGYGEGGGDAGEVAVVEPLPASGVDHLVVRGLDLVDTDTPVLCRCLAEHEPCRGAGGAQALVVHEDAARPVRVLVAVLDVAVRLVDDDARPVGVQLVGDDLGKRSADSLPHFRAVRGDVNRAVGLEGEEQVGNERLGGDRRLGSPRATR